MRPRRRTLLCAVAAALLAAGCASLPVGLDAPQVSLSDLSLQGGGLFEQRIGLVLRVVNPNRRELAIDGMSFELELNGKKFARGVSDRSLSIPGLGEALVDKRGHFLGDVLRQLGSLGERRGIDYRLYGKVLMSGFGSLPFERKGESACPISQVAAQAARAASDGHAGAVASRRLQARERRAGAWSRASG